MPVPRLGVLTWAAAKVGNFEAFSGAKRRLFDGAVKILRQVNYLPSFSHL